jgi:hypothetical protein
MHMSLFKIILKYYFPSLSPLGLAPRLITQPPSHLPAPSSLPTLWMLSPPSLIHRGRSAPGGVFIFYKLICIHISTSAGFWPSTLKLPSLTNHISLQLIQNLAHWPIEHIYNSLHITCSVRGSALGTLQRACGRAFRTRVS